MIWASCVYMIMYVPVDEQEFLGGGIWSWHNVRERYERCMFSAALAGRLTMAPVAFARHPPGATVSLESSYDCYQFSLEKAY